jgi:hypothetical protein
MTVFLGLGFQASVVLVPLLQLVQEVHLLLCM